MDKLEDYQGLFKPKKTLKEVNPYWWFYNYIYNYLDTRQPDTTLIQAYVIDTFQVEDEIMGSYSHFEDFEASLPLKNIEHEGIVLYSDYVDWVLEIGDNYFKLDDRGHVLATYTTRDVLKWSRNLPLPFKGTLSFDWKAFQAVKRGMKYDKTTRS